MPKCLDSFAKTIDQCRRVHGNLSLIRANDKQHDGNYKAEIEAYFEHWESFMGKRVKEFSRDGGFEIEYGWYMWAKQERQDDEDPKAREMDGRQEGE